MSIFDDDRGTTLNTNKHTELANHAWSVADLLRGDYKQSDYGKVILPFTVLRRLECVLKPTRGRSWRQSRSTVIGTSTRTRSSARRRATAFTTPRPSR
ncbi:type I restriction-modification system subunit M N-terminal domain-containing protein [Saccharopolyspora spinosporotrichia]